MIIQGYLNSFSKKKIVIVGDVPYTSYYSNFIKKNKSDSVLFVGYINKEIELVDLYKNCYAYVHGHEFGGTNPTLVNAINFNCRILTLDTKFSREMLGNKINGIFFNKNQKSISSAFKKY